METRLTAIKDAAEQTGFTKTYATRCRAISTMPQAAGAPDVRAEIVSMQQSSIRWYKKSIIQKRQPLASFWPNPKKRCWADPQRKIRRWFPSGGFRNRLSR
jgi:hypothetical protein